MITLNEARLILADNQIEGIEVEKIISSLQLIVELMYDKWIVEQKDNKIT